MKIHTKKSTFKKVEPLATDTNCCKYLESSKKRKYSIYIRDRQVGTTYYLITLKGNHVRAYSVQYINKQGMKINTFLDLVIPGIIGNNPDIPVLNKKLIAKQKFGNYLKFIKEFKNNSQSLVWL